jgi:aryl sulfotransferase
VKPTIWLASYPKSGNTWLRMLLNALCLKPGEALDINALTERDGIASARGFFDRATMMDSGLLTHDEIDCLRPRVYEELARGSSGDDAFDDARLPVRFVKVHDAYVATPEGEPLLAGARGATGAILIIRDPRDVAPSLANHNRSTIDAAIAMMNDRQSCLCGGTTGQSSQLRQRLLDWSGHAESWLTQNDLPVRLLRYEDLQADAEATLAGALAFAGLIFPERDIRRAVAAADFSELRKQEQAKGFSEWPAPGRPGSFFRRGAAGVWREELTAAQIARIEAKHAAMMQRLGYNLSGMTPGLVGEQVRWQ